MKQRGGLSRSWCASCSKQVTKIGLDDACAAGLSALAIVTRHRPTEKNFSLFFGVPL
jgi:hypothetical protein